MQIALILSVVANLTKLGQQLASQPRLPYWLDGMLSLEDVETSHGVCSTLLQAEIQT
jgi:hypothetical protein